MPRPPTAPAGPLLLPEALGTGLGPRGSELPQPNNGRKGCRGTTAQPGATGPCTVTSWGRWGWRGSPAVQTPPPCCAGGAGTGSRAVRGSRDSCSAAVSRGPACPSGSAQRPLASERNLGPFHLQLRPGRLGVRAAGPQEVPGTPSLAAWSSVSRGPCFLKPSCPATPCGQDPRTLGRAVWASAEVSKPFLSLPRAYHPLAAGASWKVVAL